MSFDSKLVSGFLCKLSHPLEEVRFRALKNIFNKIERKILTINDLCEHNEFILYLLEWFNYDIVKHHELVFKLLEMASEIETVGIYIIKVRGIEFLSQLKVHSIYKDTKLLDKIINNLLKINPDHNKFGDIVQNTCSYVQKNTENINSYEISGVNYNSTSIGYFNSSYLSFDTNIYTNESSNIEQNNLLKTLIYPIIPLTVADKKVLSESLSTLNSKEISLVISGIQFFTEVILEDFPAPVFLQRQGVLKILLKFISNNQYSQSSIRAVWTLCQKIRKHIYTIMNPNSFSSKTTFGIMKQISSDYEEEYWQFSDELLDFEYESNIEIPVQLPIPVFALQIVRTCLDQFSEIDGNSNYTDLIQLICTSFQLFRESLGKDLRKSHLLELWNLNQQLIELLLVWSKLLKHFSNVEKCYLDIQYLSNNRKIYFSLFSIFWDVILNLYSPEMALKCLKEPIQLELCRAQFDKCLLMGLGEKSSALINYVQLFDQTLAKIHTESTLLNQSLQSLIWFFLNNNEPIKYAEQCISASENSLICLDFVYGDKFCSEFVQFFSLICSTEVFSNREDLFVKCDEIIEKLMKSTKVNTYRTIFTEMFEIVKNCINSEELSKPNSGAERKIYFILRNSVFKIFMIFGLNSKLLEVKDICTAIFCRIFESQGMLSLGIWDKAMSLLKDHILFLQSLTDTNTRIGRLILKFSINLSGTIQNFEKELPIKGNLKINIINAIPLLYNKNKEVRQEACQYLEQFISVNRLWVCRQFKIKTMSDFLVSSSIKNIHSFNRVNITEKSVDVSNFKKVFDLYLSNLVDISVRKSAAEQLGIFLQMPNMYHYFISNGGLNYILDLLKGKILDRGQISILAPSTVLILLRIVQHLEEIRENLSQDSLLIESLIQMAIYYCYDKQCVVDISSILALIAFNSVIKQSRTSFIISLPDILKEKFILPFHYETYSILEPTQSVSILSNLRNLSDQKWCYQKSLDCNLRIYWNILRHNDLDNYLTYRFKCYEKKVLVSENYIELLDEILPVAKNLVMTESDSAILNNSIPQLILCDNLYNIDNAIDHSQVQKSLFSIKLILILIKYQILNVNIHEILGDFIWLSSLKRFLLNVPSCSADYNLLEFVLDVLENIMELPLDNQKDSFIVWIITIMTTPNNSLMYCFQKSEHLIGKTDSCRLILAKNKIESRLPNFFVLLLRYINLNNKCLSAKNSEIHIKNLNFHKTIYELSQERLKKYNDFPFDNLTTLLYYTRLMSTCLEMKYNFLGEDNLKILSNCVKFCWTLISKFKDDCDESSITFMGIGAMYYLIKILVKCLCNFLDNENKNVIESIFSQNSWLRKSPKLLELVGCRSVEMRAISTALINKLVQFEEPRKDLFHYCSNLVPDSLWYVSIMIFLDSSEAPIVRSQAISILKNLVIRLFSHENLENNFYSNQDKSIPVFINENPSIEIVGIEVFYKLLFDIDFFRKVGLILSNFYAFPTLNWSNLKSEQLIESENYQILHQQRSNINICTPLMIGSLNSFLYILYYYLPDLISSQFDKFRINSLIMNIFDINLLNYYLKHNNTENYSIVVDLILAFSNSIKLLRLQIEMNSNLHDSFLVDDKFIATVVQLFIMTKSKTTLKQHETGLMMLDITEIISQLRSEIISLLICLVMPVCRKCYLELMLTHITSNASGIFSCIKEMIEYGNKKDNIAATSFISIFLSLSVNESKSQLLISNLEKQKLFGSQISIIEDITNVLLQRREKLQRNLVTFKINVEKGIFRRLNVHKALKIILGVSKVSKTYLLKVGFIESVLVEIKYLESKLVQLSLKQFNDFRQQNKGIFSNDSNNSWKQIIVELISILEFMQNFFYDDINVQCVALSSGFPSTLYELWTMALIDSQLLFAVLNCFINLSTAKTEFARSIVICHQFNNCNNRNISVGSTVSLVESLCRITSFNLNVYHIRETNLRLVFRLLSNLVWCPEAVTILLRIKFLDKFEQLNINQLQKTTKGIGIQNLWIGLLTSLSFTEDGQNAIIKSSGSGILKVLKMQNNISIFKNSTLLIIRNLCTHPLIKVKLIANDARLIDSIFYCLDSRSAYIRKLTLSTLKALVYSSPKVRSYLKSTNVISKLSNFNENDNDSRNELMPDIILLIKVFQDV